MVELGGRRMWIRWLVAWMERSSLRRLMLMVGRCGVVMDTILWCGCSLFLIVTPTWGFITRRRLCCSLRDTRRRALKLLVGGPLIPVLSWVVR